MSERDYSGSCHCGAIRFRFRSEPITRGIRCNCSICIRRGAVMSDRYLPFEALDGEDALVLYRFGDHDVDHYFCKTCGIHPFSAATAEPSLYRINLGCVDDVDPLAVETRLIDGRSF